MIYPNKFTPLGKSMVGKMSHLMMEKGTEISLTQLMENTARYFIDVGEFILALDTLFALGKIELDEVSEVVRYVS